MRDTLPMSAVGKILYRVLRDEHAAASIIVNDLCPSSREALSGLEFFRKMIAGEFDAAADAGRCSTSASSKSTKDASCSPRIAEERFYNGTGVAHGGFAATLLDSALGCAINSTDAGRASGSRRSS